MLVLLQEFASRMPGCCNEPCNLRQTLAALEDEAMGFNHRQLTLWLLEHWRLPEVLTT